MTKTEKETLRQEIIEVLQSFNLEIVMILGTENEVADEIIKLIIN